MLTTTFTRLIPCDAPIQLAPMPSIATAELAAAVSNAGGLGMVAGTLLSADAVERHLEEVRALTERPFGIGFLIPFLQDRAPVEAASSRARVVEFFFGEPDADLVALAHGGGALVGWQVGSRREAVAAERAGCDYVAVQGTEAGGHVRGQLGSLAVVAEAAAAVKCPVVAAGGIGTAAQVAAVLSAGAAAARLGTRFVAAAESGAHPRYVELLVQAEAEDTVYTEAFSMMWPAPHRVLRSCIDAAGRLGDDVVGETPTPTGTMPVPRFSVICPSRDTTGEVEAMALYAGQSVSAVTRVQPAASIVRELVDGAAAIFARRWE